MLEQKPLFINVGRGDIIDEESLLRAIRSGWISAATLDVLPMVRLCRWLGWWVCVCTYLNGFVYIYIYGCGCGCVFIAMYLSCVHECMCVVCV